MDLDARLAILGDVSKIDKDQIKKALSGKLSPELIRAIIDARYKLKDVLFLIDSAIEGGLRSHY
jgi:hypothetical protein